MGVFMPGSSDPGYSKDLRQSGFRPMPQSFVLRLASAATALTLVAAAPLAHAQASDPAAARIDSFDSALIKTLQAGKSAGPAGRAKVIGPAVESTFDLPTMVRFAVGPAWTTMAPDDQAALQKSFSRFTIANYAKNFSDYSGQKLTVAPDVQTRGVDKVVKTNLTGGGTNVVLSYRMRDNGSGWKVIDVYYNGAISQLTTQRSDFSATLASGGAKALIAKLDAQTDKLLK
jgi:phospholipid transport system substrate-binding protein